MVVSTMRPAVMLSVVQPDPTLRVCRECSWGRCRFSTMAVKAYIIAYRQAKRGGDDPADYIRDCVRPSRPGLTIDPPFRGERRDRLASVDIKLSLEHARDVGGLALEAWNAEKVALWMCERAGEVPVD